MATTTTSSLSDTLPSSVPKLEAEGKNWAIFYVHFMDAVEAKGFWRGLVKRSARFKDHECSGVGCQYA